ncbi:hypothetical protein BKK56_03520 [Rodentibacter genomosp. 2]|uniref:hypothetical protein n=1 Tax=Rodentibacter genomosp. 2 TaxID=1908266 RepID=UPI000985F14A|nr:hypothetical protein BKK56_03520 [Rodentibacter genomosp. 2]
MTLLFRKDWYTLDETVNLLNDYFQLHPFDDTLFNHSDVIQYFIDGHLKLTTRISVISNEYLSFVDSGFIPHEFRLIDATLPLENNEIDEFSFTGKNYTILKTNKGERISLHAHGLFDIIRTHFKIKKIKDNRHAFLVHGLYPSGALYDDNALPNNRAVYIHCKKPILIPFSKIIISREDVINTIKNIKELEHNSLLEINSVDQERNTEKDSTIEELQTKITELENQLQARQSAVNSQEVLPVDENYNPTERETHLLMIDAMAKLLTNQNFNVNRYIRGKSINKKQISEDIAEHITKVLNTPETTIRSAETIRKRLNEALKLNE